MGSYDTGGDREIAFDGVLVVAVTDAAFYLSHPDVVDFNDAQWFPKSQIDWTEPAEPKDFATFYIPQWLADKKGWA